MVKDPVCGMMVNSKNPPATSDFSGQTFYFCCSECKEDFEKDPARFAPSMDREADADSSDSNDPVQDN